MLHTQNSRTRLAPGLLFGPLQRRGDLHRVARQRPAHRRLALAPPVRLHRGVEGVDRSGLVKHDEDVDNGFRAEPGNRRAADVMDL